MAQLPHGVQIELDRLAADPGDILMPMMSKLMLVRDIVRHQATWSDVLDFWIAAAELTPEMSKKVLEVGMHMRDAGKLMDHRVEMALDATPHVLARQPGGWRVGPAWGQGFVHLDAVRDSITNVNDMKYFYRMSEWRGRVWEYLRGPWRWPTEWVVLQTLLWDPRWERIRASMSPEVLSPAGRELLIDHRPPVDISGVAEITWRRRRAQEARYLTAAFLLQQSTCEDVDVELIQALENKHGVGSSADTMTFKTMADWVDFIDEHCGWKRPQGNPGGNPISPTAYQDETQPCALTKPWGASVPDDRSGAHFTTSFGLAARYALFKASRSQSIGIVFEYDLTGLELVPDHDAVIEKEHGDYTVKDISYYIDEFDILEDPESPDCERLADLMQSEAEQHEPMMEEPPFTVMQQLIDSSKTSIFSILADKLVDWSTADEALQAIKTGDVPLAWWAEVIAQVRTYSEVGDERLVRVLALKPVEDEIGDNYPDELIDERDDCPAALYLEDLDYMADVIEQLAVTLWERPGRATAQDVHYHGTDLTRARCILGSSPAGAALTNPWDPCVQP